MGHLWAMILGCSCPGVVHGAFEHPCPGMGHSPLGVSGPPLAWRIPHRPHLPHLMAAGFLPKHIWPRWHALPCMADTFARFWWVVVTPWCQLHQRLALPANFLTCVPYSSHRRFSLKSPAWTARELQSGPQDLWRQDVLVAQNKWRSEESRGWRRRPGVRAWQGLIVSTATAGSCGR